MKDIEFDYIIVTNADYSGVMKEAETLYGKQIQEKMIAGRVLQHPDFDFAKYIRIRKHVPSIISQDCFGGILYSNLGLPFLSPTINMFWTSEDYYKLLSNLKEYMEKPLIFKGMAWGNISKIEYPVCSLGDIQVHMNHYKTYEEAKEKWEQRVQRIDYDNLFIVTKTSSKYWAEKFCGLSYKNKMCFTSFEMEGCIDVSNIYEYVYSKSSIGIAAVMHESTCGRFNLYNPFDILDTGDEEYA